MIAACTLFDQGIIGDIFLLDLHRLNEIVPDVMEKITNQMKASLSNGSISAAIEGKYYDIALSREEVWSDNFRRSNVEPPQKVDIIMVIKIEG